MEQDSEKWKSSSGPTFYCSAVLLDTQRLRSVRRSMRSGIRPVKPLPSAQGSNFFLPKFSKETTLLSLNLWCGQGKVKDYKQAHGDMRMSDPCKDADTVSQLFCKMQPCKVIPGLLLLSHLLHSLLICFYHQPKLTND